LAFAAAIVHADADERRTAEYLLRHRSDVRDKCSASRLVAAARRAAEMDERRRHIREAPTERMDLSSAGESPAMRVSDPSVGERVVDYVREACAPSVLDEELEGVLLGGVAVAMGLAERHLLNGGAGPSLLAMRPDARAAARLVVHLRREFGNPELARAVSRLLIGGDGTSMTTALLWWVAQGSQSVSAVPVTVVRRWRRDIGLATAAMAQRSAA
jgi:hypothetical protein